VRREIAPAQRDDFEPGTPTFVALVAFDQGLGTRDTAGK
jgi:hypothetical protein